MRSLFKDTALLVALTCGVWIAVLWRWRTTQHDMDAGDAVRYLCVLPVVVFGFVLLMRGVIRNALARHDAKAAAALAAEAASHGADSAAASPADDKTVPAPWHLLGGWVHTAGGADVDALLAAVEAGSPRPGPDSALHDEDGLPVVTARIAKLDTDAIEDELQRHADALPETFQGTTLAATSLRSVRALATLSPLVDELGEALLLWSARWEESRASPAASRAGPSTGPHSDPGRIIRVLAAWPSDWDETTCATARSWLTERLCDSVGDAFPTSRWSIVTQPMSGTELLSAAQRMLDVLRQEDRDDPVLLIACHSDLDDAGIRALETAQRLFHSTRRPRVSMPGEGSAILAVSAVQWPAEALPTDPVRIGRPVLLSRSQSIEAAGRASADDTLGLVRIALARSGHGSAAIANLATDADQHTARTTELFAVTLALLPELDPNDDLRLAGTLTGRLEAASPLVAIACAAAQARQSSQPALALSLADPHARMVSVLVPESFAPDVAPA